MRDFTAILEDNYQYYLDEVYYKVLAINQSDVKPDLSVKDSISYDFANSTLKMTATRTVGFVPESIFKLSVSFGAEIKLKEGIENSSSIDWQKEFESTPICVNILQTLYARISMQISQITSSYGQNPLVTPPDYLA